MSMATDYNGPQLTAAAISAHVFCAIDPTTTPDTVNMLANGTTAASAFVSRVGLDSGQPLYGMQDSGYAIIKLAAGQNPGAEVVLTSAAAGEGTAATTGDYGYAVTTEPASGAAGYVRAKLIDSPIVQP